MNPIAVIGAVSAGVSLVKEMTESVASMVAQGGATPKGGAFAQILQGVNKSKEGEPLTLSHYMKAHDLHSKPVIMQHVQGLMGTLTSDPHITAWHEQVGGNLFLSMDAQGEYVLQNDLGHSLSLKGYPHLHEKASWMVGLTGILEGRDISLTLSSKELSVLNFQPIRVT